MTEQTITHPPTPIGTVRPRTSRISQVVTLIAVIVPPLGILSAMGLLWGVAFHWVDVALLAAFYVLCAFGTTIGFHRYFTHRGFETRKPLEGLLAILGCMTMQGPLIAVGHGPPQAPRALRPAGRSALSARRARGRRLGRGPRVRARARRLALRQPRDGAGPGVREGSLREPARPNDRPSLHRLGGRDARPAVR